MSIPCVWTPSYLTDRQARPSHQVKGELDGQKEKELESDLALPTTQKNHRSCAAGVRRKVTTSGHALKDQRMQKVTSLTLNNFIKFDKM
jgi:hypothetical protein